MPKATIAQCKEQFAVATIEQLPALIHRYSNDERTGIHTLLQGARRRIRESKAERARLEGMNELENLLREQGVMLAAGVDEVGRGAIAGPVTAAAVVLPPDTMIESLNDSKKLTPEHRVQIGEQIEEVALAWHVAHVPADQVDANGIAEATKQAMRQALEALDPQADHIIVDGLPVGLAAAETAVVGGDSKVAAIAAASILAKVSRDDLMRSLARQHPEYGFEINKGYGTAEHIQAIHDIGPCRVHRRSFAPCSDTIRLF